MSGFPSKDKTNDVKFDPFGLGSGRQSVPLPAADPSISASGRASAPLSSMAIPSEDQQLAWAARESLKMEEDRKKEEADLMLAIALSKVDTKKL